jgi:hypothetical protein
MSYHIDTGLIKDKIKEGSECPLCQVQKIVEEQFLHEFLNDAVMEDDTRAKVNKKGFCDRHFDMLFERQNKLSVALQIQTRSSALETLLKPITSGKSAKKTAEEIEKALSTCIVCELTEESMIKYYKVTAQLFARETSFAKHLLGSNGFCIHHYAMLLKYSRSAGFLQKQYLEVLSNVQNKNFNRLKDDIDRFCAKHDYRNANMPLGSAENALPNMRIKLYGEKIK